MRKLSFFLLCLFVLNTARLQAQCAGGRYVNKIFPAVTMSTVTYSTPYSLQMDIYRPTGDTLSARPLIILAHGGSFISGTRADDATVDTLCKRFAQRGYVTASIDYRLGTFLTLSDSAQSVNEVIQAVSDGKAAIRYFVKDAATTNTYKIDTNNIFIGGNSAGAVLYMHVGYLDSMNEAPLSISAAMMANGGFDGNSGNAGYSTLSKAIINLAGGLNMPSFAGPGDKPSVNAQGDNDNVVPYTCAHALAGSAPVTLCGLGSLEPVYVANGINHMSHVFVGDTHVPWASDPVKLNTVDSLVTVFLSNFVCVAISSVNNVNMNGEVSLFPNPASEILNITSGEPLSEIMMLDETGRAVFHAGGMKTGSYEINTSGLNKGIYFVRLKFADENIAPVVRRVAVE